jgi:hypothetical protein
MIVAVPRTGLAQSDALVTPPPNIVVPNYNSVPVGPNGGLEASTYVARASDPSAAWFNPAGLSRATGTEIAGSAGMYQFTSISPKSFPNTGGSVQNLPNLVGFDFKAGRMTLGAVLLTTVSWDQETDAQNVTPSGATTPERFAYSADANFTRRVLAASVGYDTGRAWRVGAGLAFSYTTLRMVQTVSDRIAEPTDLRTLLLSSRVNGSIVHLRPIVGVQVEPSPTIRIGGTIKTSGFAMFRSGSATFDGTESAGPSTVGASFFDPSARFDYNLPFEGSAGVAVTRPRADLEVDVQFYSGIDPYSMFSSGEPVVTYQDAGTGARPTVQSRPFGGLTTASRAIANVSVGGGIRLSETRPLRLHYGVSSNLSPVAPEDQVFDRVTLVTWTIGLSGSAGKLSYAAGVNYSGGTSDNLVLHNLLSGQPVQTTIGIRTIGMIYSLSYQF